MPSLCRRFVEGENPILKNSLLLLTYRGSATSDITAAADMVQRTDEVRRLAGWLVF